MTTSPYGQPEPFDPGVVPAPVARPAPPSKRRFLPIVGAVVLAVVAFAGGFAVANATATKSVAATNGNGNGFGNGNGQGFGPGASGRPRNGSGGNASGTVGSVSAGQMTVTTQSGSKIVLLTPTTTITEVSSTTKAASDIAAGNTVTVVGTANPDGSVTATSVIIGTLGGFGRGFGGPDQSPAPSATP